MSSIFLIFLIYFLRHSWTRFDSAMDMHLDAGIFHRGRRGRRLNLTCDFLLSLALVLLLLLLLLHSVLERTGLNHHDFHNGHYAVTHPGM